MCASCDSKVKQGKYFRSSFGENAAWYRLIDSCCWSGLPGIFFLPSPGTSSRFIFSFFITLNPDKNWLDFFENSASDNNMWRRVPRGRNEGISWSLTWILAHLGEKHPNNCVSHPKEHCKVTNLEHVTYIHNMFAPHNPSSNFTNGPSHSFCWKQRSGLRNLGSWRFPIDSNLMKCGLIWGVIYQRRRAIHHHWFTVSVGVNLVERGIPG